MKARNVIGFAYAQTLMNLLPTEILSYLYIGSKYERSHVKYLNTVGKFLNLPHFIETLHILVFGIYYILSIIK